MTVIQELNDAQFEQVAEAIIEGMRSGASEPEVDLDLGGGMRAEYIDGEGLCFFGGVGKDEYKFELPDEQRRELMMKTLTLGAFDPLVESLGEDLAEKMLSGSVDRCNAFDTDKIDEYIERGWCFIPLHTCALKKLQADGYRIEVIAPNSPETNSEYGTILGRIVVAREGEPFFS